MASSGKLYAYSDAALKKKTTGSYIACATDEVYVQAVNLTFGSVKLSYPVTAGRKSMYFKLTDIMCTPSGSSSSYYADHKIITYRRASTANQYGWIQNESVAVLGKSGNFTQIIYNVGAGNYKMGFVKTSDMTAQSNQSNNMAVPSGNLSAVQNNIYNLAMSSVGTTGADYQKWAGLRTSDPYCAAYATYIANQAMIKAGYSASQAVGIVPKHVSTSAMADWYNKRERYHSYVAWYNAGRGVSVGKNTIISSYLPQVGDLVVIDNDGQVYSGPEHTGLVIAVNNNSITLAEGNTGAGTNATRKVKTHIYYKGSTYWYRSDAPGTVIVGFCTPAY